MNNKFLKTLLVTTSFVAAASFASSASATTHKSHHTSTHHQTRALSAGTAVGSIKSDGTDTASEVAILASIGALDDAAAIASGGAAGNLDHADGIVNAVKLGSTALDATTAATFSTLVNAVVDAHKAAITAAAPIDFNAASLSTEATNLKTAIDNLAKANPTGLTGVDLSAKRSALIAALNTLDSGSAAQITDITASHGPSVPVTTGIPTATEIETASNGMLKANTDGTLSAYVLTGYDSTTGAPTYGTDTIALKLDDNQKQYINDAYTAQATLDGEVGAGGSVTLELKNKGADLDTKAVALETKIKDLEDSIADAKLTTGAVVTATAAEIATAESTLAELKGKLALYKSIAKTATDVTKTTRARHISHRTVVPGALTAVVTAATTAEAAAKATYDTIAVAVGTNPALLDDYLAKKKAYADASALVAALRTAVSGKGVTPSLGKPYSQFLRDAAFASNTLLERRALGLNGAWIKGSYAFSESDLDSADKSPKVGYDGKNLAIAFGFDKKISNKETVGAFLSYNDNGGESKGKIFEQDKKSVAFGVYGTYQLQPKMYISDKVAYNTSSFDNKSRKYGAMYKSSLDLKGFNNEVAVGFNLDKQLVAEAYLNTIFVQSADMHVNNQTTMTSASALNSKVNIDSQFYNAIGFRGMFASNRSVVAQMDVRPFARGFFEFNATGKDLEGKYTQAGRTFKNAKFESLGSVSYGLAVGAQIKPNKNATFTVAYSLNGYENVAHSLDFSLNLGL